MPEQRHVKLFRNGRNQAVRIPVEFALLKTMKPLEEDFPKFDDPEPAPETVL